MTKSLERVSKLLAVAGVALLMWTGAQTAKAQVPVQPVQPVIVCAILWDVNNNPTGCQNGGCAAGYTCAYFPGNVNGYWYCCL